MTLDDDMLKIADDVKLIGWVDSAEDVGRLRMDLTRLGSWAENWRMMFNVEKCKVMNIGFKNREEDYALVNSATEPHPRATRFWG